MLRIVFALLNVALYAIGLDATTEANFFLLTVLLLAYNSVELRNFYKKKTDYFFLSPIFIACVVNFGLVFGGITNFLLINGSGNYMIKGLASDLLYEKQWLTKTMYIVNWASLFMWLGFDSGLGTKLFKKFYALPVYHKLLSSTVSEKRLYIIAIFAYLIKLYLFSIGLYGRIVDEKYFESGVGFKAGSQIRVLSDLSYVTFFLFAINKFKDGNVKNNVLFFAAFAVELLFGFVYGARGPFITPFLIVFLAYYLVNKRIRIGYVALVVVAVYMAFTVVLDFKNYTLSQRFSRSSNAIETIENFNQQQNRVVNGAKTDAIDKTINITLTSMTFVPETAMAIRQADKHGMNGLTNPSIIETIATVPFDAAVPRFIQGSNEFPWGLWFKDEVLQVNLGIFYSIAFSPIGFLYMGGGIILVVIGFYIYGMLLRFTYQLLSIENVYSILVYMMLLSVLYNLDSVYSNALIYFLRYLFIFPLILWALFDKKFFSHWRS